MTYSARALCEALARTGVTITARSRTVLYLTPRAAVDDALIAMLTRYKPELLGALWRAAEARNVGCIAPCRGCDSEFMIAPEQLCPWCKVTVFNSVSPLGCHESAHLNARSAPKGTVPNCPRTSVGDSGDSYRSIPESHTHAHAPERVSGNAHATVSTLPKHEAA